MAKATKGSADPPAADEESAFGDQMRAAPAEAAAEAVVPVGGEAGIQYLKLLTKRADGGVDEKRVLPVRFVPLVPGK